MSDTATTATAPTNGNGQATATPAPAAASPLDFPEMPYSWNATVISPDGYSEQFTVRAVNHEPFIKRIGQLKDFFAKNDYKPQPARGGYTPTATATQATESGGEPTPICDIHKSPMEKRQGKNGAFWSCPKKLDNGKWCPYRP